MSQQWPEWMQFRQFNYVYNPGFFEGFTGTEGGRTLDVNLAYRINWTAIEGAPRTALLGLHYTNAPANMSTGAFLMHDRFGPVLTTRLQGFYNYRLRFSGRRDHGLSIGLGASLNQFRLDGSKIQVDNPGDQLLLESIQTRISPNISAGLYYYLEFSGYRRSPQFLIVGIAVDQVLEADVLFEGKRDQVNWKQERHYNGMVAERFYLRNGIDFIEPVVIAKVVQNNPIYLMGGGRATIGEQLLQLGLLVSTSWEAHLQFNVEVLPGLSFGYGGAFFLTGVPANRPGMSHELGVRYRDWW